MKSLAQRQQEALDIRIQAAKIAHDRVHPDEHVANDDERRYVNTEGEKTYLMNFTKGLRHDAETGLVADPTHYQLFVKGIDSGDPKEFEDTPLGPGFVVNNGDVPPHCKVQPDWKSEKGQTGDNGNAVSIRAWESAGAGLTFDTQGPDSHAVTMKPVPKLGSAELTAEMGEVYVQALLRDIPLATLYGQSADSQTDDGFRTRAEQLIHHLNELPYFQPVATNGYSNPVPSPGPLSRDTAFRGITPGDRVGPYLSQFMLMGNTGVNSKDPEHAPADGYISYGALRVDQRVRTAVPEHDYLQRWDEWLDAQNGANFRGMEKYVQNSETEGIKKRRFITTGRDLATYVHYDALYEAYLNACLILLANGAPFDAGIPFQAADLFDRQQGFAQFGGPHILTLVPEVATRALKAVRFQKFNIHRRLRPEALAARLQMQEAITGHCITSRYDATSHVSLFGDIIRDLEPILSEINQYNPDFADGYAQANAGAESAAEHNYLLPMAFCEGSPMHPSYGAGHATVAGACITIMKAFFDTNKYLKLSQNGKTFGITSDQAESQFAFVPRADGEVLETVATDPLSVGGELNKLAANISIGRNWAGVHYYSDYVESLRMGEQIAIGILQEQSIMYNPLENVSMTLDKFDGSQVIIKYGKVKTTRQAEQHHAYPSTNGSPIPAKAAMEVANV